MSDLSLHDKLIIIQSSLKVPKANFNSFGKYKYRSNENILEAVKTHLKELNLTLIQRDDVVLIGDRYYIKSTAVISDGKQTMENCSFARESSDKKGMDDAQISGTASSYARKYALNGLFLLDDTKDSDTDEYKKEEKRIQDDQSKRATAKAYKYFDEQLDCITEPQAFEEVYSELKTKNGDRWKSEYDSYIQEKLTALIAKENGEK